MASLNANSALEEEKERVFETPFPDSSLLLCFPVVGKEIFCP